MADSALTIRLMRKDDIPDVMKVELAAYPFPWTEGIFKDCLHVGYPAWVGLRDRELVAYVLASVGAGEAHLLNICVRPDLQGLGYGKRMLETVLDGCKQLEAHTVYLEVRASNVRAKTLYLKSGFTEIGTRKNYYPAETGKEHAVVLSIHI